MDELEERGERRHESCRYGQLSEGYAGMSLDPRDMKPIVVPICGWLIPQPAPPGATRAWGGNAVEFARDCAVCDAYHPL